MFPANLQMQTRASQLAGTANVGGNMVETQLLAEQFIDALRKQLRIAELGATMLPGLVGNVAIPRRTSTQSTYWVAESGTITAAATNFDQVSMTPKTVGALSSWSRILELQSTPAIESLLRADMVAQVASAIDLAAITGTGSSLIYGASKAAMDTAGLSLARVLGPAGIRVVSVSPAAVLTDFVPGRSREVVEKAAFTSPLKTLTEADDVAVAIMGTITHLRLTTGVSILVDGGKHL
jgi:NAD(P)-dependent dehydrogenase (short-subunit alcohol dehydrogenase family)